MYSSLPKFPTGESDEAGLQDSMLCHLCIHAGYPDFYKLYADRNGNRGCGRVYHFSRISEGDVGGVT